MIEKKLADEILSTLQARKQHVPEIKICVRQFFKFSQKQKYVR